MSHTSPFPGMDPWLEDYWGDVHTRLTTYTSDRLQPKLPTGLRARIEEYVAVESSTQDDQTWRPHYVPDVMITEKAGLEGIAEPTAVATLDETTRGESEAIKLPRLVEPPTLRSVQIVDTQTGNRVVTSIEFLSPANKSGRGLASFCKKQQDFLDGGVNLVEIDLVRSGDWAISIALELVPPKLRGIYRALVVRAAEQADCEYYPIPLASPLPKIKVPLRPTDADVILELQPLLELAYINGGYAAEINYNQSPINPLPKTVAEWGQTRLKARSLGFQPGA